MCVIDVRFVTEMKEFFTHSCHRCHGTELIVDYQAGDIVCTQCGEVLSDRIIDASDETIINTSKDGGGDGKKSSRSGWFSADGALDLTTNFVCKNEATRKALEKVVAVRSVLINIASQTNFLSQPSLVYFYFLT